MASIPRPGPPFRRFRVFLSYAHERKELAEHLAYTLESEGHDVFFDRHDLPPGKAYTDRIRTAIQRADLFVFLISPESVTPGTFALSELKIAVETAGGRRDFLLGVLVHPTDAVPTPLRATTYLVPQGDVVAETANEVAKIARARRRRNLALGGAGTAAAALACAALYAAGADPGTPGRGADSAVVADSPAADTAGKERAPASEPPTAGELARFHVEMGELYLSAPEWLARAGRYAEQNPLAVEGEWLNGVGVSRWPTTKHGKTPITPEYGVFHATLTDDVGQALEALRDTTVQRSSSAHLVIGEDGSVAQLAPLNLATYHTGRSASGSAQRMNSRSIGIQLVNWGAVKKTASGFVPPLGSRNVSASRVAAAPSPGSQSPGYWETYPERQLFRAVQIAQLLHRRYRLADFIGHYDVRGDEKVDPGPAFPLPMVRLAVYGGDANGLAVESFRRALAADPGNATAAEGIKKVVTNYVELARQALGKNDRRAAEDYVARAAELARGDARVDSLRARLRAP